MENKHFFGYQLSVNLSPDQTAIHSQLMDVAGNLQRQVINLKEEMTRKALIQAGWTPPDLQPEEKRTMYKCTNCDFLYGGKVDRCDCLPQGQEQQYEEWVAYPKSAVPSLLQDVLHCRYPVCTSIRSEGHNWDTSRLDEVIDDAIKGSN